MKRKRIVRYAIWSIVALVVLGGVFIAVQGSAIPVQMTEAATRDVRQYVAEDAKTRLAQTYTVDMPVPGTLERVELEVGDWVDQGAVIAHVDVYELKQQILEVESLIGQARAQIAGVDIAKPKPEDLEAARIRVTEAEDALEIARNSTASLEFNVEEMRKNYERARELAESGAGPRSVAEDAELRYSRLRSDLAAAETRESQALKALEQARLAQQRLINSIDDNEYMRETYEAEIEGLEARLAKLKEDYDKTAIRAPVSGPVLEKFIEDRRVLAAGTPILELGDLNTIEIEADILSEEIGRVRVGNPVEITGKTLEGRGLETAFLLGVVKRIYPSGFEKISALGVEQQRVKTLIDFDNDEAGLRPETSVDVRIITAESSGTVAIPDRAAFRRGGQWYVFRVEDGRAILTPVELGLRNEEWAEIVEGLAPGDRIIAELKNDLEDGVRVTEI